MNNIDKVLDLFAGCGGMTAGFTNAGFDVVAAVDIWQPAIDVYKNNFKHEIFNVDIANINKVLDIIHKFKIQTIIGGPPCQDFSHAGKRKEGKRANLTVIFANIVKLSKPHLFVMENVDRIKSSKSYAEARKILKFSGYGITEIVINACYAGVPQNRKRFFSIGMLGENDSFLENKLNDNLSEKPLTIRQYLNGTLKFDYFYRHPRNYNRRGIFSVDEPSPTIRGVNRPLPPGYHGHKNDPVNPSENIRSLTTFERARIQTFPEDYQWTGTKTNLEQMIGNAVPVKLAEFVANSIIEFFGE